jgi:hypothetical protein
METFDFRDMTNVVRRLFQEVDENHDGRKQQKKKDFSILCFESLTIARDSHADK